MEELRKASQSNDFEIGGLYTVNSITDTLQLVNGSYTKTLNGSCILRDSTISAQKLAQFEKGSEGVFTPVKNENVPLVDFIVNNLDLIRARLKKELARS